MGLFDNQKIGVAFCTPVPKVRLANGQEILDTITMEWHRKRTALALGTNINFVEFFADGMEVGVARDGVARRCLAHDPVPEYVFFLDYDVLPEYDAFSKLFFRLQTMPKFDVAAGVYTCKWASPSDPLIYAGDGCGAFWDWTIGDLLTTEQHGITGTHMGLTLIRTSLFRRMLDAGVVTDEIPFFKTVKEQFKTPSGCLQTRSGTEDLYFYRLAAKVGCQILVDTSVLAGHIDKRTGITWGLPEDSPPVQRAKWIRGEDRDKSRFQVIKADTGDGCWVCDVGKTGGVQAWLHRDGWKPYLYLPGDPNSRSGVWATREDAEAALKASGVIAEPLKLALDLGAGGTRRSWPGHKTYTTDLRADSKPDYVQDTRWLNLPNDHYDLVASSHHMEHIPRFEQERAWGECFRVCKPGGAIEHIVPSGDWVAAKIADGQMDEHVMNVLYGAQESHGYERELNLHYFLYTKDLAKALAEAAGFADVRCEDWRDRPELGYNLIVRGTKPLPMAEEVRDGARTTFIATHAGPPPPAGGWPDDDEDDTDLHDPAPPEKPTMSILAALASCDLPPTAYVG